MVEGRLELMTLMVGVLVGGTVIPFAFCGLMFCVASLPVWFSSNPVRLQKREESSINYDASDHCLSIIKTVTTETNRLSQPLPSGFAVSDASDTQLEFKINPNLCDATCERK